MIVSFLRRCFRGSTIPHPEVAPEAAEASGAEEQFYQGLLCASRQGGAQDYVQAARWYAKAAEQNHSLAQYNLATMYGQGQGVVRDEAKALIWLTRAANLGDAGAQYRLGVQHHISCRNGGAGVAVDERIEALKWVRLSATQGYHGAAGACEYVAMGMTLEQVAEGEKRAGAFVASSPMPG
jgi:TPR repeat protein